MQDTDRNLEVVVSSLAPLIGNSSPKQGNTSESLQSPIQTSIVEEKKSSILLNSELSVNEVEKPIESPPVSPIIRSVNSSPDYQISNVEDLKTREKKTEVILDQRSDPLEQDNLKQAFIVISHSRKNFSEALPHKESLTDYDIESSPTETKSETKNNLNKSTPSSSAELWKKRYFKRARICVDLDNVNEAVSLSRLRRFLLYVGPPIYKLEFEHQEAQRFLKLEKIRAETIRDLYDNVYQQIKKSPPVAMVSARSIEENQKALLEAIQISLDMWKKTALDFYQDQIIQSNAQLVASTFKVNQEKLNKFLIKPMRRQFSEELDRYIESYLKSLPVQNFKRLRNPDKFFQEIGEERKKFSEIATKKANEYAQAETIVEEARRLSLLNFSSESRTFLSPQVINSTGSIQGLQQICAWFHSGIFLSEKDFSLLVRSFENMSSTEKLELYAVLKKVLSKSIGRPLTEIEYNLLVGVIKRKDLTKENKASISSMQNAIVENFISELWECWDGNTSLNQVEIYDQEENTLLHYALQTLTKNTNRRINSQIMHVIKALYDRGAVSTALNKEGLDVYKYSEIFSRKDVYNGEIGWDLLVSDLRYTAVLSEAERYAKSEILNYSKEMLSFSQKNILEQFFSDPHGLRRAGRRYEDVQNLGRGLGQAVTELDDNCFVGTVAERKQLELSRGGDSRLFKSMDTVIQRITTKAVTSLTRAVQDQLEEAAEELVLANSRVQSLQQQNLELSTENLSLKKEKEQKNLNMDETIKNQVAAYKSILQQDYDLQKSKLRTEFETQKAEIQKDCAVEIEKIKRESDVEKEKIQKKSDDEIVKIKQEAASEAEKIRKEVDDRVNASMQAFMLKYFPSSDSTANLKMEQKTGAAVIPTSPTNKAQFFQKDTIDLNPVTASIQNSPTS